MACVFSNPCYQRFPVIVKEGKKEKKLQSWFKMCLNGHLKGAYFVCLLKVYANILGGNI